MLSVPQVNVRSKMGWAVIMLAVLSAVSASIGQWQTIGSQNELEFQQRLGRVLAQQAARLVGIQGRIVTITTARGQSSSALKAQMDAFEAELIHIGDYEVREYTLPEIDSANRPLGTGLSWAEYQRVIHRHAHSDLIVSFAGAPSPPLELGDNREHAPRLLAECASTENLRTLFAKELIATAVVPRFGPGPGSKSPVQQFVKRWFHIGGSTPADDSFADHYQIVTPALAASSLEP